MKKIMFLLFLLHSLYSNAQTLTIEGSDIVCINTFNTATVINDLNYDTYQWYKKYSYDDQAQYEMIDGANTNSLTYGMDYNEHTIKLITTLNNEVYESNEITLGQLWSFGVIFESVMSNPHTGHVDEYGSHFCEGDSIQLTVLGLFSANVQWYKDEVLLEGENNATLIVTEPGYYHAVCSTEVCPEDYMYSLGFNALHKNCTGLSNENNVFENSIQVYPNPTNDVVYFDNSSNTPVTKCDIYTIDGKKIVSEIVTEDKNSISLNNLSSGTYLIKFYSNNKVATQKIIKK